ncbi:MAG: serine--tRNA ligase, partial [Dehalococcoidia bacterium]
MLSLQFIRQNLDLVQESLAKRGEATALDEILSLDERRRRLIQEVESLRARRRQASKEIGQMKEKPAELLAEMRDIGEQIKSLDHEISRNEEGLSDLL